MVNPLVLRPGSRKKTFFNRAGIVLIILSIISLVVGWNSACSDTWKAIVFIFPSMFLFYYVFWARIVIKISDCFSCECCKNHRYSYSCVQYFIWYTMGHPLVVLGPFGIWGITIWVSELTDSCANNLFLLLYGIVLFVDWVIIIAGSILIWRKVHRDIQFAINWKRADDNVRRQQIEAVLQPVHRGPQHQQQQQYPIQQKQQQYPIQQQHALQQQQPPLPPSQPQQPQQPNQEEDMNAIFNDPEFVRQQQELWHRLSQHSSASPQQQQQQQQQHAAQPVQNQINKNIALSNLQEDEENPLPAFYSPDNNNNNNNNNNKQQNNLNQPPMQKQHSIENSLSIGIAGFKKYLSKGMLNPEENEECAICFDDYSKNNERTALNCGHVFHKKCAVEWLNENPTCPMCRTNVVNIED